MSLHLASLPERDFVRELFDRAQGRRAFATVGWCVALGAHALAATLALDEIHAPRPAPPPVEVELVSPEPPPAPVAEPPPPAPAPEAPTAVRAASAPPAPAQAGALLTAKADPTPSPSAEEPVDFTHDPSTVGFGAGVVAIGGKAKVGLAHAQPSDGPPAAAPAPGRGAGDGLTAVSDLSRKPSLGEADPCRGHFPSGASDDVASAAVLVTIGKTGSVSNVKLLSESPPQQGFGAAARACMATKRFSPGLDRDGKPAATAIRVNIRFRR